MKNVGLARAPLAIKNKGRQSIPCGRLKATRDVKASLIKNPSRAKPGTEKAQTTDELEATLGASFKALRLSKNISQKDLAERAGIGTTALKHLENGHGAKVATLVRVARALGRESWLENAGPVATINPLTMVQGGQPRQRALHRKKPRTAAHQGQPSKASPDNPGDQGGQGHSAGLG